MSISRPNLSTLNTKELRALFQATLGIPTMSNNRPWMIKRISNAPVVPAQAPAAEPVADVLVTPLPAAEPAPETTPTPAAADPVPATSEVAAVAVPAVGSEIRKTWRGQELIVTVQADGFLLNGTVYRSLSAAATALCGGNRNGLVFFGLKPRPVAAARIAS